MFFKVAVITVMATWSSLCALLTWNQIQSCIFQPCTWVRHMAGYATDQEHI